MFFAHCLKPGASIDVAKTAQSKGLLRLTSVCLVEGASARLQVREPTGKEYSVAHVSSERRCGRLTLQFDLSAGPYLLQVAGGTVDVVGLLQSTADGADRSTSGIGKAGQPAEKRRRTERAGTGSTPRRSDGAGAEGPDYIAAAKYEGPRPGMVFMKGSLGVGYYRNDYDPNARAGNDEDKSDDDKPLDFVRADAFSGARPGMVFKKGAKGVGYYRDTAGLEVITEKVKVKPQDASATKKITLPSGLKYEVVKASADDAPKACKGKFVKVRYMGRLRTGKIFDKGHIRFRLGAGEVIKGWELGIEGMQVGEHRKLVVPPKLGYGPQGAPPDIPGNATLSFDVELMEA